MSSNVIEFSLVGTDKFSGSLNKLGGSLHKIAAVIAKLALAVVAVGAAFATMFFKAAKSIVAVGSKVENLRVRLDSLLGSTMEGGKAFDEMAKFAATVPFAFDEIMESATALAGVVTGGSEEIAKWMPMIADLATVSGLSIKDTTGQVQRMMSAGASAADMFRERGITQMLGFQAGVAVSAEETKRKLVEAFEDPLSKFRGASQKMATTWTGVMSMIGDKWFQFKKMIADAGIFNYIKAIAIVFDKWLGAGIKSAGDTAKSFSDFMIGSLRNLMSAVGFLADMFRGLQAVWQGLQIVFATVAVGIFTQLALIETGIRKIADLIPTVDVSNMNTLGIMAREASDRLNDLNVEFQTLIENPMPSEKIAEFRGEVDHVHASLMNIAEDLKETLPEALEELTPFWQAMKDNLTAYEDQMGSVTKQLADLTMSTVKTLADGIGKSFAQAIVYGKNLGASFKALGQQVTAMIIQMLVKIGVQQLANFFLDKMIKTREATASVGTAIANGTASWAAAPWPINLGAPAFGLAMGAAAGAGVSIAGAAHGGLTDVPKEATYLLDRGERVLSPKQNKDLTSFIDSGEGVAGGVTIENLNISILENATNIDSLLNLSEPEMEELVAGRIIAALNNLDGQGVRPIFAERG